MAVFCKNCGGVLNQKDKYCRDCGTKREEDKYKPSVEPIQCVYASPFQLSGGIPPKLEMVRCENCGKPLKDEEKYCDDCGNKRGEDKYKPSVEPIQCVYASPFEMKKKW